MERKERRHHTREFKLEAVRLAAAGDKTKAKVARELGIRVNQLRQWRLDFEEEERNGVPKQELATAEQDLGKLRRENAPPCPKMPKQLLLEHAAGLDKQTAIDGFVRHPRAFVGSELALEPPRDLLGRPIEC